MAKKQKHPKLPNGFGSIKYLGKKRTNPYGVYPPVTEFTKEGVPITPTALCYTNDWYKGFYVLLSLKNGTFSNKTLEEIKEEIPTGPNAYDVVTKIISEYNSAALRQSRQNLPTFSKVFNDFYEYKYNRPTSKKYGKQSKNSTKAAFKNCAAIHDKEFALLGHDDLQKIVDECPLKHASKELIITLFHQMYAYAYTRDLVTKDYSRFVSINTPDDDEKGVPFSEEEIDLLWKTSSDPVTASILIMIYSGYRIAAYSKMQLDFNNNVFIGGVKNKYSKGRIVPMHSLIAPLVSSELPLFTCSNTNDFRRNYFIPKMADLNLNHTPHDCRHTFAWLCDHYSVNELTKKMLLGHSLGSDVTNSVYGHRTISELRSEIEKIKHW